PVDIDPRRPDGSVSLRIYFEAAHPVDEVTSRLADRTPLTDIACEQDPNRPNVFAVTGRVPENIDAGTLQQKIDTAFGSGNDSAGQSFKLTSAIANTSVRGAAASAELADAALLAILISLFAVVMYIRVRFAEYSFGLAAVLALVHDVCITLGAIALVNRIGLLDIEIDLTMIAAFLTIIGYSLNDTIIIFDRVRENRPRMEGTLEEILDVSINQTLSRTIMTSGTTAMAVASLFFFNFGTGNALESFSFAMLVGIVTGTYSTIFIANPALMFFEQRAEKKRAKARGTAPKTATATS
ncbi:MAG: protein translocase subunit SecF, partial [Planctomycetota bacterium]